MSRNVTPFIPPLPSPHNSPLPSAPVIPQQNPNEPVSPTWYQYSNPGAYPVYPTSPAVNMNGGYIPPYMSPIGQAPGFIPPTPLPPSASAFPAGVSQDYTGYPPTYPFAQPQQQQRQPQWAVPPVAAPPFGSYSQPMYSAPLPQQAAPQFGTPWTAGGGRPLYPAFGGQPMQQPQQQPMSAPGYGLGFGMPPAWAAQHFTPGPAMQPDLWGIQQALGGQPPPAGGAQPPPMHGPLHRAETHVGDRMDPFMTGDHYGPVLEPFLIRIVRAEVKLNPLIEPVPDTGPERAFLKWNMLFHTSLVQRSTDPAHVSWSNGRNAPATFPRVSSMRIISEVYPWMIEVRAQTEGTGVTCGEVIEAIYHDMQRLTQKEDYDRLSAPQKRSLADAYRHNRSRTNGVPGGTLGEGMKRLDFLRDKVTFGGIENNEAVVERICGAPLPCTFVLRCQHMFPMTQQEARDHAARQQQRARSHSGNLSAHGSPNPGLSSRSRAASRNSTRSRAASSPRPGIAVIPPSDYDDDDDD